jgi:methyl-accepting chemotaxis protein
LSLQGLGDARAVQDVVNRIVGELPDTSSAGEWLVKEVEQSVERQGDRLRDAATSAAAMSQKVKEIEATMVKSSQKMEGSTKRFRDVTASLDRMMTTHESMVRELALVQTRMDRERRGNQVLLVFVCLLAFVLLIRI